MPIGELRQAIMGRFLDLASRTSDDHKSLNEVVSEILKDEDIALFLAENTKKGEGLLLGTFFYADGPPNGYNVDYGLTINPDGEDANACLFTLYCSAAVYKDKWHPRIEFGKEFPADILSCGFKHKGEKSSLPTDKGFVLWVIKAILNPEGHTFNYENSKREYEQLMKTKA